MFQLQTPNIGFKHLDLNTWTCSNGYWLSKVTKGHSRSPGVTKCKKKIIAIPHKFLNYSKT